MWELMIFVMCAAGCFGAAVLIMRRRERKLAGRIQEMLEDAAAGKLPREHLDESSISAVENSMWRYLNGREMILERMKKEQRQMQQEISDISHQTMVPLSTILLYSQLLEEGLERERGGAGGEIREELAALKEQVKTLDFLMGRLMKLSRLESGIIHIRAERQPLAPVLETVRGQFLARAARKNIDLTVQAGQEEALFDAKWTVEAVSNIVDNAVKYTPEGGKVSISVEALTSLVRVDIRDNGRGISEEEQARIFTRFYRAEGTARQPGVGIGLYIAREVMRAQNGYIRVSSAPGRGSVFSLYFLR